ncbi:putative ORFan [Tupanvirus deep ocean]|uniref:ORFan n=2 Tax=Tupanvirus TaxID=2094720 RepID=A0AC62A9F9_9VIRU|nr:putative ORFan [Tupanvirus deep ocean]QKU34385.1 putative ORFan [Tupanvirus deep ocean]
MLILNSQPLEQKEKYEKELLKKDLEIAQMKLNSKKTK